MHAGLEGQRASLRLSARARLGLKLEGHLSHNFTVLRGIPVQSRLLVTRKAGSQGYDTEAELQLGECAVMMRASRTVMTHHHLQGAVVSHNNCTTLQVLTNRFGS